jgi:RNA-directed DNA polymerase
VGFLPAVSQSAIKAMSATVRGWKLQLWSSSFLEDIVKRINPVIRAWLNYHSRFYKSALYPILRQIRHAFFLAWIVSIFALLADICFFLWQDILPFPL